MKIVIINATFGIGSTGGIVRDIQDELLQRGDQCIIYCGETNAKKENVRVVGSKIDHKIHGLMSRVLGLPGYFSYFATKKMIREIKAFDPDVVHLHNLHANYVNLEVLFAYLSQNDIKTVVSLHDCFLFTGKCVHYTKVCCNKWQKSCGSCPNLNSGNPIWFFDKTKKMLCDRRRWYSSIHDLSVIGVSEWVTNEAKKSVFNGAAKFYKIYNWIENNAGTQNLRQQFTGSDNRKIIVSVATMWDDTKGLNDLKRLSEIIDSEFIMYVVGNCKNRVDKENIRFLGVITEKEQLYQIYKSAIVLFHPSIEETFGLIIAEALSVGTPAIVYNSTACPELVDEYCGYVNEPGDIEGVYRNIQRIAADGKEKYSDYCKYFAKRNFNKEHRINELFSIYEGGTKCEH